MLWHTKIALIKRLIDAMINFGKLKKVEWFKEKERDFDLFLESFYIEGTKQKYATKMGTAAHANHRIDFSNGSVFMDYGEIEDSKNIFLKQGKRLATYASKLTNNYLLSRNKFIHLQKQYKNIEYKNFTNAKLATLYNKYISAIHDLIPYSYVISNILDETSHDVIVNALRNQTQNPENLYLTLTRPTKLNITSLAYSDTLQLAQKYRQSKTFAGLETLIAKHITQYAWLKCYRPTDLPTSAKELRKQIQTLAKDRHLQSKIKQQTSSTAKPGQKIQLPLHLSKLVKIMQQNAFLRTERREIINHGFFTIQPLHREIAKRMSIAFADLAFATTWELSRFLKIGTKITNAELKKRKQQFCVIKMNNTITIVSGNKVNRFKRLLPTAKSETTIQGIAVYPGIVTGKVKIVKTMTDLKNFPQGSILVAPTIATWMVPIIDKCSGIITDFGGTLSHTAIIAREFKKPCIIGTKHATNTFKNGTTVTLNTTKGTAVKT